MATEKPAPFNPYFHATTLDPKAELKSGINWTWVTFSNEKLRQQFDKDCRANGYRVRDYGECKTQFHHYQY
jgi:hypothetical protein